MTLSHSRARILVSDGSPSGQARSTLAAVRALADHGCEVGVTIAGPHSLAARSRAVRASFRLPAADHPRFAACVEALSSEWRADALLLTSDAAILALGGPASTLVDKSTLAERARAVGLSTPEQRTFANGAALVDAAPDLGLPAIVKVSRKDHIIGPGARFVSSPSELEAWRMVPDSLVVQTAVSGPMRAVFGVHWQGEFRALGAQAYLRTWPVHCGVSCAAVSTPPPNDDELERLAGLLEEHDGIFQAQFIGDWLIDLNPRPYGSMPLATAAGLNLPGILVDLLSGRDVPRPLVARAGQRYRWLEGESRYALTKLVRGDVGAALPVLVPRRRTAHSVWSVRDPWPAAGRVLYALDPRHQTVPEPGPAVPPELGLSDRERDLLLAPDAAAPGVVPDPDTAQRRARAHEIAQALAADVGGCIRSGELEGAWSSDVDLHLENDDTPVQVGRTEVGRMHLLSLDDLHGRLGLASSHQWLIHEQGRGLSRLDVHEGSPPTTTVRIADRLRRRTPNVREVMEVRRLQVREPDATRPLPASAVSELEARLGGALLAAVPWEVDLSYRDRLRSRVSKPTFRDERVVVAFSGLDGAGKSTQVDRLRASLVAAGVPVSVVWSRPGMHLAWLGPLRRVIKRMLGVATEPGLRTVGRGDEPPRTRRGLLGATWLAVVVVVYVWSMRRPWRFRRVVVIYDRHIVDGLATLEALYAGQVRPWHRWVIRRLVPRADHAFLLSLPVEEAVRRKRDDVFTKRVHDVQARVYAAEAPEGTHEIDATNPVDEIATKVLWHVLRVEQ